jgi:hypothetical protein
MGNHGLKSIDAKTAELEIDSIRQYLEISGRENAEAERHRWLKLCAGGQTLYCLWQTVYALQEVIHAGEKNELLVQMEQEILRHAHLTLPETKVQVLPPRKK